MTPFAFSETEIQQHAAAYALFLRHGLNSDSDLKVRFFPEYKAALDVRLDAALGSIKAGGGSSGNGGGE